MTEPEDQTEKPAETPVEIKEERAAEAAAIRRRWLTLGEILAVAAVGISALTFWNSYKERSNTEADQAAEAKKADAAAGTILLSAKVERDGRFLRLIPSGGQAIQDQSFVFPPSLGVDDVQAMTDPVIDARWFDDALRKARKAAGKSGESDRIERLPVAVTTRFIAGSQVRTDTAIYDIGYGVDEGILDSDVALKGISFVERPAKSLPARLDALFKARLK